MENEERTPCVEGKGLVEDLDQLRVDGTRPQGGPVWDPGNNSSSADTTPSSEEASLPRQIPGRKAVPDLMEEKMSQSYHEIFETQVCKGGAVGGVQEDEGRVGGRQLKESGLASAAAANSGGNEGLDVLSPLSDKVESSHSGSTETGQPIIPKGDVYLRDGRLVCEEESGNATQYLTSKLVADSLMWQQTFRNDSPSPEEVPPKPTESTPPSTSLTADPLMIEDIERQARRLATDVDNVTENLACILQSISALTVETVETYRDGVCKTCDAVDDNIKGMYQLMAKWEELNKSMGPAYKLSTELKEIKRLLDVYEATLPTS